MEMAPSSVSKSSSSSSSSSSEFLRYRRSEHMQSHMMMGHGGHSCRHNHHHFHKGSKHGGPKKMKGGRLSASHHHLYSLHQPHQCIPKHHLKPYKKLLKHARKLHKKKACRPFLCGLCPPHDVGYHQHHSPSCCLHYPRENEHPCHAGFARPRCHGRSSSPTPGAGARYSPSPEPMEAAPPVQPDEAEPSKALKELSTEGA